MNLEKVIMKPGMKIEAIAKVGNILLYDFFKNKEGYGKRSINPEIVLFVDKNNLKVVKRCGESVYLIERPLNSYSEREGIFHRHQTTIQFKDDEETFEINGIKKNAFNWGMASS